MAEFVKTERGYVALSAVVAVERSYLGRAVLRLNDGTEHVTEDSYEEFCAEQLSQVVPNHTAAEALVISLKDLADPLEDGLYEAYVNRFPVIAWRISASSAEPVLPLGTHATHIRYPSGQVESFVDGGLFDHEEDAIQEVRRSSGQP